MAKVKKNPVLEGLSGKLGDIVFRQTKDGRTIITKKPDFSNRQFSQDQIDHQGLLKQAAAYAKEASKANPIYAEMARDTAKNAYNIAISDWFKPPVIHGIQEWDGCIRVDASDNVLVTQVVVAILDSAGQIREQGNAELVNSVWWEYQPASQGRIRVEARDLAGNVTRREF